MSTDEILHHLQAKNIALSIRNGRLVVRGEEQLVDDPALVSLLRENRQALIELIQTGKYGETGTPRRVSVPPNRIPAGCRAMTPEMLSMVALTAAQIETLVAQVPGGVPNIQDVYPLTPLQEGILFHHLMADDDPYVLSGSVAFSSREDLDAALRALEAALGRHDILRTAIFWEKLPEPLQVVLRKAVLRVEEVSLDASATDAVNELHQRFDGRRFKLDLHQAPLARVFIAYDQNERRWLLLLLLHHLVGDHATLALLQEEIEAYLQGRGGQLPAPVPFRNFVAEARLGVTKNEHETYFRQMLGDVDEPTAPFGLLELHGDTPQVREAALDLPVEVALRIRRQARQHGVSTASLCHLAWAEVLARVSGRNDIVFGTVLFGRMNSSEGVDRVMGPCINTLPLRIRIDRQEVAEEVRHTHKLLAELVRHEHASLALAQRSSAVPAPTPLFSSILNYRHSTVTPADRTGKRLQWVGAEERTNYPVTLSVDDLGVGLRLAAQVFEPIDPIRICRLMETALARVASALEQAPKTPLNTLDVLPAEERRLVLYGWNDTAAPFTTDACVHQLFEKEAVRSPEAVALVFEGRQLCYDELNRRANQL
ncbi:MAG TPA: condensation domain-containing protein, partial [Bryobacteraceae bacterium]|nr:condensation domain-containing protein [Bryobacteraceae bacterium]